MTDLAQVRAAVLAALNDAGVTIVEAAGALEPRDAGRLLVVAEDVVRTLDLLVGATRPTYAAVTPADEETFSVHLVGSSWVAIGIITQAALERVPDEEDDEGYQEPGLPPGLRDLGPELRTRIDEVIDELSTTLPISDHRDAYGLIDKVMTQVEQTAPELAEQLGTFAALVVVRESVSRLQAALKERHIMGMQRDARDWAEKVYAQNPIPARSRRPRFQEAAYRFMKRLDGQCATRMTTEAIAIELEVVADEHASRTRLEQAGAQGRNPAR